MGFGNRIRILPSMGDVTRWRKWKNRARRIRNLKIKDFREIMIYPQIKIQKRRVSK